MGKYAGNANAEGDTCRIAHLTAAQSETHADSSHLPGRVIGNLAAPEVFRPVTPPEPVDLEADFYGARAMA